MTMTKDGIKDVTTQEEKAQRAGFNQPTGTGPKPTPAPIIDADNPLKPDVRSNPMIVKGTISNVNTTKKILVIEDVDGIIHGFNYLAELEILAQKQKPGWFVEVTYRVQGDRELLSDVKYSDRPAGQQKGKQGNWQPKKPRITIAATVNLQNYENIKVEVEANSAEECTKILIDTLNRFATNPNYSTTRDMIQSFMARVLNTQTGSA